MYCMILIRVYMRGGVSEVGYIIYHTATVGCMVC